MMTDDNEYLMMMTTLLMALLQVTRIGMDIAKPTAAGNNGPLRVAQRVQAPEPVTSQPSVRYCSSSSSSSCRRRRRRRSCAWPWMPKERGVVLRTNSVIYS